MLRRVLPSLRASLIVTSPLLSTALASRAPKGVARPRSAILRGARGAVPEPPAFSSCLPVLTRVLLRAVGRARFGGATGRGRLRSRLVEGRRRARPPIGQQRASADGWTEGRPSESMVLRARRWGVRRHRRGRDETAGIPWRRWRAGHGTLLTRARSVGGRVDVVRDTLEDEAGTAESRGPESRDQICAPGSESSASPGDCAATSKGLGPDAEGVAT